MIVRAALKNSAMAMTATVTTFFISSQAVEAISFSPSQMSEKNSFTLSQRFRKNSTKELNASGTVSVKNATIASTTVDTAVLIFSHRSIQNCRNSSDVFQKCINAATAAAIAATMSTMGFARSSAHNDFKPPISVPPTLMTVCTADTIFGAKVMIVPTAEITLPTTMSSGPMAATMRPIFTMVSCWAGDRALNLSTRFWIKSATFWIVGASA